jgi:hypothetical protein
MYNKINMRILYIIFTVVFVFNSCQNKAKSLDEVVEYTATELNELTDDERIALYENVDMLGIYLLDEADELPPLVFPNIQEVNRYITQNMQNNGLEYNTVLDDLHKNFMNTSIYGLFGYNYFWGVILADLDKDRTYELYLNADIGSGIVHSFIHGYNPRTGKYYILSKRTERDYFLFIYNNILYVLSAASYFSNEKEKNIEIFELKLLDDEMILEEIKENIQYELGSINISDVSYSFELDLIRNNTY